MAQHRDAVSAYSALNEYIVTSLRGLVDGDANPLEAPQGEEGEEPFLWPKRARLIRSRGLAFTFKCIFQQLAGSVGH